MDTDIPLSDNPYNITLYPVDTPSGATINLMALEEQQYYKQRQEQYLTHNHFTNVSDLQDVDRLLTLEVMVYRWSVWLTRGFDYVMARVDEHALKTNIKEYCVSEDTEVLTRRGWVTYFELIPGEDILTLNRATGLSEWQPTRNLHIYVAREPLIEMRTRDHSSLTTKNHRWWVERATKERGHGNFEWRETSELDQYCWVPTAAPHAGFDDHPKYSDSLVELAAWWWTEGSCTRPGLHNGEIAQSEKVNPTHVRSIRRALLHECGEPGDLKGGALWNETRRGEMVYFNLSKRLVLVLEGACPNKVVDPRFLLELTEAQLNLFIQRSIEADGWVTSGGSWSISQRKREMLEAFQFAAVLAGYQANMRYAEDIEMWRMNLSRRDAIRPSIQESREVEYRGLVWCPEVENGTWLARREGSVFFTGNSTEIRLLKQSLGLDKVTREKDKGESIADYLENLRRRARHFGVHRDNQYQHAVTLMSRLRTMVATFDRCDEEEREELDLSEDVILEFIRNEVIKPWDQIDEDFRENQKMWIKEL